MFGYVRDLVLLTLMCLVLYCTGLDTHGVTNWQEAQRVVVAREMQRRAATDPDVWIVPRHNGQAYIAKPPMIYWVTVGLAELRGGEVELFDLRLAVALAGTLGVLGTYVAALGMLRPVRAPGGVVDPEDRRHIVGARWAAVFLATGLLYFRSSRIGELDILLVPSVVGAVGCIWGAWRFAMEKRMGSGGITPGGAMLRRFGLRAHWPAVVMAGVFAGAAALTKGPPALMVIALAGYGGMVLKIALEQEKENEGGAAAIGGLGFAAIGLMGVSGAMDVVGVLILGVVGAGVGVAAWRMFDVAAARKLWFAWSHTHPVVVLGMPLLAFWWWGSAVSSRIGPELAMSLAKEQADNDLNLFMPISPVKNLEALAYGCGVGSVLMLVAGVWWVKFRPRLPMGVGAVGVVIAVAWVVLSYGALSMFGKGVARYLTPVWPGVAIVAAAWVVRRRDAGEKTETPEDAMRGTIALAVVCGVLGIGQTWWYGYGREVYEHERSPQAIMAELKGKNLAERYGSYEFYTPALDYYAGEYVQPIVNAQMGREVAGGPAWTLEELRASVEARGPMVVLCRERSLDAAEASPVERMKAAGLVVEAVETEGVFRIDNARTHVRAVRVSVE